MSRTLEDAIAAVEASRRQLVGPYDTRTWIGMMPAFDDIRTWIGRTPAGAVAAIPSLVAEQVRYRVDHPQGLDLVSVSLKQAINTLAFLAVDGPVMPRGRAAPPELLATLTTGLSSLGETARFYSNGEWHRFYVDDPSHGRPAMGAFSWRSLSEATFDAGIVGFNDDTAFILWVEEED